MVCPDMIGGSNNVMINLHYGCLGFYPNFNSFFVIASRRDL